MIPKVIGSTIFSLSPIPVLLASHAVALPILPCIASCQAVLSASQPLFTFFTPCVIIIVDTGFSTANDLAFETSHSVAHKTPPFWYPSCAMFFTS